MRKIASWLLLTTLLALGLQAAPAQAQLSRTAVSAARGNDANNCDLPTPCRTLQVAHDKTNTDGEITVLDPGGYGALTITKSISIVNDGVGEASILVSGGATGITINAGAASYVNLRGLTVQGIGFGGGTGLRFNTGFSLTIENCVFRNHTGNGIEFFPTGGGRLAVSNTVVADNGKGPILNGISVVPSGPGAVKVSLSRVKAYNNGNAGLAFGGQLSTGTLDVTVADSVSANNAETGFYTSSQAGRAPTRVMLVRSTIANNKTGLYAGGSTLRVGQTAVTGNRIAWNAENGGVLQSYGDNNIDGNVNGDPAPGGTPKK